MAEDWQEELAALPPVSDEELLAQPPVIFILSIVHPSNRLSICLLLIEVRCFN